MRSDSVFCVLFCTHVCQPSTIGAPGNLTNQAQPTEASASGSVNDPWTEHVEDSDELCRARPRVPRCGKQACRLALGQPRRGALPRRPRGARSRGYRFASRSCPDRRSALRLPSLNRPREMSERHPARGSSPESSTKLALLPGGNRVTHRCTETDRRQPPYQH